MASGAQVHGLVKPRVGPLSRAMGEGNCVPFSVTPCVRVCVFVGVYLCNTLISDTPQHDKGKCQGKINTLAWRP